MPYAIKVGGTEWLKLLWQLFGNIHIILIYEFNFIAAFMKIVSNVVVSKDLT